MPTALPAATDFTGAAITEAQFKTAMTSMRTHLADLLGVTGTPVAALQAMGVLVNSWVSKTGAYTVVEADRGKLIGCSGTFTLSLTAAATLGADFSFAVLNYGTGTITINPNSTEQIDAATTIVLAPGESCMVICTSGTAFRTIGRGVWAITGYGTSGQVLKSAGAGLPAAWGADNSTWALVETRSVSAITNEDFDLQEDVYCEWKFVLDNIIPATDGAAIRMRPGYGGTFETSSLLAVVSESGSVMSGTGFEVCGAVGSNGAEAMSANITVGPLSDTRPSRFTFQVSSNWLGTDGASHFTFSIVSSTSTTPRLYDAVRFLPSSGSFEESGTIKMYGLRRAG
jgi:hypothetical protein